MAFNSLVSNNCNSTESLDCNRDMSQVSKAVYFGSKMLHELNELRKSGTFCDAKLNVSGKQFNVHKVVLASSSSYFRSIFTVNMKEKRQDVIELTYPSATPERMDDFLTFLYTSEVSLTHDNVEALIVIADYFNVQELKELGCAFLQQNLNLTNGIALHDFAEKYHCEPLREITREFLVENFSAISKTEEFLYTSAEQLLEIVSSEELVIFNEEELYVGILRWVKHDPELRSTYFCNLFAKVRIYDVDKQYLSDVIANEPLVQQNKPCLSHLMQTLLTSYTKSDIPQTSRFLDCVLVNGGRCAKGATAESYLYVPAHDRWFSIPHMSTVRYSHGVATVCGNVIVLGGYSKTGFTADIERFDLETRQWTNRRPLQRAMKGMAVAVVDGCLYLAGGIIENGIRLGLLLKYDPNEETWETKASMKIARSGACLVALDNHLYAIGGKSVDNRMLSSMERYTTEKNVWENMASMSQKRAYSVAATTSHKNILVVGGINEVGEIDTVDHGVVIRTYVGSCEMYSPIPGVWFTIADVGVPRAFAGVAVLGDLVYVFGGEGTGTRYYDSVECYNCATNTWQVVSHMPKPKKFLQCSTLSLPQGLLKTLIQAYTT